MSVVWIIESEQWARTMVRAELIERGLDAVGYPGCADALAHTASRSPDLIVVDLREATRDEIADLFGTGAPVIGIASAPEPRWRTDFKWAAFLRRPVSIGDIADEVMRRV